MRNTNDMWLQNNYKRVITYIVLPEGYFYKGQFYTPAKVFKKLIEDGEIIVCRFDNGLWVYEEKYYKSLEEVYEYNEEDLAVSYKELKRNYKPFGIYHNPQPCTLYMWEGDEFCRLLEKGEILSEIEDETNYKFLCDVEEFEEYYINELSEGACIEYLNKPIKERIQILNEWGKTL